jgi:hypothetical protein
MRRPVAMEFGIGPIGVAVFNRTSWIGKALARVRSGQPATAEQERARWVAEVQGRIDECHCGDPLFDPANNNACHACMELARVLGAMGVKVSERPNA